MFLREGINTKKKSSLFDIHLRADHMMIHGFHKLKLTYIRVIRHYGVLCTCRVTHISELFFFFRNFALTPSCRTSCGTSR